MGDAQLLTSVRRRELTGGGLGHAEIPIELGSLVDVRDADRDGANAMYGHGYLLGRVGESLLGIFVVSDRKSAGFNGSMWPFRSGRSARAPAAIFWQRLASVRCSSMVKPLVTSTSSACHSFWTRVTRSSPASVISTVTSRRSIFD